MRLPHIPHTIIYNTNSKVLRNKLKSNNAIRLVKGVQSLIFLYTIKIMFYLIFNT